MQQRASQQQRQHHVGVGEATVIDRSLLIACQLTASRTAGAVVVAAELADVVDSAALVW